MAEKLALAQQLERVVPAFTRQACRNFDFGVLAYFDNPAVSEWQHHSGEIEDLLNRPAAEISLEDDQVSVLNLLGEKNEEALANFKAIDELVSQENDGNHGDMLGILAAVMFPGNDSHRRSLTNIMFVEGWRAKYPEDGLYVPAVDIYPRSRARQQHEVLAEFPLLDKFPAPRGENININDLLGTTLLTRGLELMVWLHQKGGNQDLWQAYKDAVKKGEIPVGDIEWKKKEKLDQPGKRQIEPTPEVTPPSNAEQPDLPRTITIKEKFPSAFPASAISVITEGTQVKIEPNEPIYPPPHKVKMEQTAVELNNSNNVIQVGILAPGETVYDSSAFYEIFFRTKAGFNLIGNLEQKAGNNNQFEAMLRALGEEWRNVSIQIGGGTIKIKNGGTSIVVSSYMSESSVKIVNNNAGTAPEAALKNLCDAATILANLALGVETQTPEIGGEIVDDQGQVVEFDQKDKLRLPVKTKDVAVVGYVFTDFKSFQSAIKKAWEKAILSGKKEFELFMEFQKVLDDGQKVTMGLYGDDINSLIKAKNVPEFVLERAKNFAQSDTPPRALRLFNMAYTVWTDTFIRLGWAQKQEFESVETVWEKLKGEILKEEKAVEPERQEGKQKPPSMPTW